MIRLPCCFVKKQGVCNFGKLVFVCLRTAGVVNLDYDRIPHVH